MDGLYCRAGRAHRVRDARAASAAHIVIRSERTTYRRATDNATNAGTHRDRSADAKATRD